MKKSTKVKMLKYANSLDASEEKGSAYRIAYLKSGENTSGKNITEMLLNSHRAIDAALRDAAIMKRAGCATEDDAKDFFFGTFTFEDGSKI